MVVLRPNLVPTVGNPQAVALQNRMANLADQIQQDPNNPALQQQYGLQGQQQYSQDQQEPTTEDFIKAQFANLANKTPAPELNPSDRVTYADPNIAARENFQGYYDNMNLIDQVGKNQLQAEQARAAFRRMQQLQAVANQSVPTPNGSGGVMGTVPSNPKANFGYAQSIAGKYGWNDPGQLGAWYQLGMKESGWNNNIKNPTSTAFGIGQFLDSTWSSTGIAKTSDPAQQVEAMARYIKARYGSPAAALAFHNAHNWY